MRGPTVRPSLVEDQTEPRSIPQRSDRPEGAMPRACLTCASVAAILVASKVTAAPQLPVPESARTSAVALESAIPGLAHQALAQFPALESEVHRNDRLVLELAAGEYGRAAALAKTSPVRSARSSSADLSRWIPLRLYADARVLERRRHEPFAMAFRAQFKATFAQLDDPVAFDAGWALGTLPSIVRGRFEQILGRFRGVAALSLADVLSLATA